MEKLPNIQVWITYLRIYYREFFWVYAKRLLKLVLNVCPIKQLYIIDNSANILKVVTKLINFKFMQLLLKFKMITRLQKRRFKLCWYSNNCWDLHIDFYFALNLALFNEKVSWEKYGLKGQCHEKSCVTVQPGNA